MPFLSPDGRERFLFFPLMEGKIHVVEGKARSAAGRGALFNLRPDTC